ncbi:unnamed protein product [Rotaria magnacalcarata]|uniref:Tetratricopeptide repeat protein n=2 Tax=Rotaria magnacalcarata TaxID=392030 RepID=A0A816MLI9_9BILA|nr:unnamed protein product [Rotaria magnacalcarata]CAF1442331.1 unnamed protein product [Rotaria magnacalcarata]CAF1991415.1 unnamed protein product [Rotaria magnacalcarata]CAF3797546.1 unnamed protein product [Rotaria magnacalcarata]CAF3800926.1 unnamed protein product [Rotaria magnacalcarata]
MGITPGSNRKIKSTGKTDTKLHPDIFDVKWIEEFEKSFVFVWCDASIGTNSNIDDYLNTIKQLARIVNQNRQLVHTFNEFNACRDFIKDVNNVCLIVSGSMGQELVPIIHNYEQIHSIYIFCIQKEKYLAWAGHYPKVRGVCTEINEICESLKQHVTARSSAEFDRVEFDLITMETDPVQMESKKIFLFYSKINRAILLNMNSSDHGKKDMISYCRNEYRADHQLELINSFDLNYAKNSPIYWYTKNFFFQGIINRALRTNDLYALYSMHRFIKDLDSKLLETNDVQRIGNKPLNLFFGQFLSQYDFDKIKQNIGGLVSINQFVSANPELSIAVMYIEQQKVAVSNGNTVRVVFQIHIDETKKSIVPYANIGVKSQFVHEREYLISMFSVYRIDKIERLINVSSAWVIHMTLINKNDQEYNRLTENVNTNNIDDVNLTDVGYTIMSRLHLFKSTNKLFKQALPDNSQALRAIILHYNMGIIYDGIGEYEMALEEYTNVRTIGRLHISNCDLQDHICLVPSYSNKALVYEEQSQFDHAITHGFRALEIAENFPESSILKEELKSSCYYNLGSIHNQAGRTIEARKFYQKALDIRQAYLPLGHPDVTILQRLITLLPETLVEVF